MHSNSIQIQILVHVRLSPLDSVYQCISVYISVYQCVSVYISVYQPVVSACKAHGSYMRHYNSECD